MLSGRKMYVLGTVDGAFRPIGAEHLVGEMGGVWAHPLRCGDGWIAVITDDGGQTLVDDVHHFTRSVMRWSSERGWAAGP